MIDTSAFELGSKYNITLKNGHFYIVEELLKINAEKNYIQFIDRVGNLIIVDCTQIVSVRLLR